MKWKKNILLLFWVLAGIIMGALIASLAEGVQFLSWLSFSKTIGIDTAKPLLLDFSVLKIAFGFEFGISVAQVLTIVASLFLYKATVRKIS